MKTKHAAQCMLLVVLALCGVSLRAQIRVAPNQSGSLVYVNDLPVSPTRANLLASAASAAKSSSNASAPRATTPQELDRIVETTAHKHSVDPRLQLAAIKTESNLKSSA